MRFLRKVLSGLMQDAEQNYGLLMYRYRIKSSLSGRVDDWQNALKFTKMGDSMAFKFNDGFDDSRSLRSLSAQRDEGSFICSSKGKIDFERPTIWWAWTRFPRSGNSSFPSRQSQKPRGPEIPGSPCG
jgi:hypothetical protein